MSTTRPSPLAPKSFQRYERPQPLPQSGEGDVFEKTPDDDEVDDHDDDDDDEEEEDEKEDKNDGREDSNTDGNSITPKSGTPKPGRRPPELDELPIELATLTDRFIDSLSAKVHNEPPTIDSISDRFQDFYTSAASSIDIHISALRSRLNRERWPGQAGITTGTRPRGTFKAVKDGQQMLTPSEVTEKRKARKLLEYKRLLLEEAVEKRACEKVYDKIWRHKSTMDEVRDEKLRSKTATLALVGIGLKDLGIQLDDSGGDSDQDTLDHLQQSLAPARDGLARMNDERSPLGKLKHLQAAHKAIVDTLYTIHPSGSSADEILPTLIYTLITSPVQGINIISNLSFIQRFRAASKIDGEAAYCMTNLEAAIVFLEDVDLASFGGRGHDVGSSTPVDAQPESEPAVKPSSPSAAEPSVAVARPAVEASSKALPAASSQRTLSNLLQPITTAPSAARRTAEGSIGTISSTLDNSFRFLLSRLGEKSAADSNAEVVVPKTLDEVRQLVNRPATPDEADAISDTGSPAERDDNNATTPTPTPIPAALPPTLPAKLSTEDKILNLISGGRRRTNSLRDASVDSQRSTASKTADPSNSSTSATPLDAVKTFSASINNPISQIGSAFGGALRSFGSQRGVSLSSSSLPTTTAAAAAKPSAPVPTPISLSTSTSTSSPSDLPPSILLRPPTAAQLPSIAAPAPIPRFVALKSANELTVGDLPLLLHDYQRLARLLDNLRLMGLEEQELDEVDHQEEHGQGQG